MLHLWERKYRMNVKWLMCSEFRVLPAPEQKNDSGMATPPPPVMGMVTIPYTVAGGVAAAVPGPGPPPYRGGGGGGRWVPGP